MTTMTNFADVHVVEQIGDATDIPEHMRPSFIAHVCNDVGAWGAGFVVAISKKWKDPERQYRQLARNHTHESSTGYNAVSIPLGINQYVNVEPGLTVVNMIAQRGIDNNPQVRTLSYDHLDTCLRYLYDTAKAHNVSYVNMPRIGAGLAGGSWPVIKALIETRATVPTVIWSLT